MTYHGEEMIAVQQKRLSRFYEIQSGRVASVEEKMKQDNMTLSVLCKREKIYGVL